MNKIQNNKILAVRKTSPLVCVWRSTGEAGTPLLCNWVGLELALAADIELLQEDRTGGLLLCA